MLETPGEMAALQDLLDRSAAAAGPHLAAILIPERRLDAEGVCARLQGMRLLVVATVTADGRPLAGPVEGYLLHGSLWFSSARDSVRIRHLAARPGVSATHLAAEALAVTVHGEAELHCLHHPACADLRGAMVEHHLARQGPGFVSWLAGLNGAGARVRAERMLTFHAGDRAPGD